MLVFRIDIPVTDVDLCDLSIKLRNKDVVVPSKWFGKMSTVFFFIAIVFSMLSENLPILKPYVLKMRQALVDRARDGGYNTIMEPAMQAVDSFMPQIKSFKDAGYETCLSVISVPNLDCFLSTLNRYSYYLDKDGFCRRNTKMDPEMSVKLRNNLVKLDESGLFDNTEIFIRGNSKLEPPKRIYSKLDKTAETPLQALNRGESLSLGNARQTFMARASAIREVLSRHNDDEKIEQLDWLEGEYRKIEDRGEYHE